MIVKKVFGILALIALISGIIVGVMKNQPQKPVYYVDAVEGNDENSGLSPKKAWKSLAKVNEMNFRPGDVIQFKKSLSWSGGLVIDESGTEEAPITFTSYGDGEKPAFSNQGDRKNAVTITGSWIIIDDFLVRDAHYAGVQINKGAQHNTVQNCEAVNVGIGFALNGQYNLITHNYAHNLTIIRNTEGGDDDYGAVGVWLFNSNNEVSYNRMMDCKAPCYDYEFDGGAVEWYGDVDNCYVHHNWATGCEGFFEIGGGSAKQNTIVYNVSINNSGLCWIHLSGKFGSTVENLRFENNTVIEMGDNDRSVIGFSADPAADAFIFRNNIIYTNRPIANRTGFTHDHNIYYNVTGADVELTFGEGELQTDPKFVDFAQNDFHLQKGSPAIDAGTELGHTTDFDDVALPVGQRPDIGAFEYTASD